MNETLTGRTTRPVTFIDKAETIRLGTVTRGHRHPAGTFVYVTGLDYGWRIRIPGTLLEQDVDLSAVEPA